MEAEGLVARSPDPVHRRATLLRLTPYGEERFAEISKVLEPSQTARFGSLLNDQELDQLEVITRKVREANQPGRETRGPAASAGQSRETARRRSSASLKQR